MNTKLSALQERESRLLFSTYARYPVAVKKARGTMVYDFDGREYVDLLAGISVCNLGHCHPELAAVMAEQAAKLVHMSNLFYYEEQLELAQRLVDTCGNDRVFFCNSGAEANEAAIKLARRYMHKVRGRDAHDIITLQGSFHGRTLATIAATGQDAIKDGFEPLPPGFTHVPPGDIAALERAVTPHTAGVLVEIIQGEGGVRPLTREYLLGLERLCRERDILLMVDEVQTGLGRTGTMWAHQHFSLAPDIFTSAKGLANGLPMGAMLATEEVAQGFAPGSHATTFGGGPLLSAVAAKVLEIIQRDRLVERAREVGGDFSKDLEQLRQRLPERITHIRGRGLMIGIELAEEGKQTWARLLEAGFICNLSHQKILRLLPPLTVSREELARFVDALARILEN
ncbi:MAG: aspartate aminotransferase family protein [Desulfovibrionales bacterium]